MTIYRFVRFPIAGSTARTFASLFLPINSIMQSYLHRFVRWCNHHCAAQYRERQARCLAAYGVIVAVSSLGGLFGAFNETTKATLLGAALPGAGFLHWSAGDQIFLAAGCIGTGLLAFGAALLVWFATGNVLAPLVAWMLLAWVAGRPELVGLDSEQVASGWQFGVAPTLWMIAGLTWIKPEGSASPSHAGPAADRSLAVPPPESPEELSWDDLQRLRLLLDRALQPVEQFEGFEWRDQFQTAAVRYQVNFMAYALAIARQRYAPAAEGYFLDAQKQLLAKIGDRRLWRYWQLENAWGRLRFGADPVPHENIMYSGFTALQMAISGNADDLVLHSKGKEWRRYSLAEIAGLLEQQYRIASYGLLACEPNWIYPLCNLITATGIRAADARTGAGRWQGLASDFLESLAREGTRADGSFIAFRSALTGIASPAPGGIVMQAFPCLFLNCLDPGLAHEHWRRVRHKLAQQSWQRLFWPVDVGNYGFSRASGYAATAAVAVELGDSGIAQECLQRLEAECPSRCDGGIIHRRHASLWAHALELTARCGGQDGLRELTGTAVRIDGPRLVKADYPDVLVAGAHAEGRVLRMVLYPGDGSGAPLIELGGLMPERHYHTGLGDQPFFKADREGRALMHVPLRGRTSLTIKPVI